MFQATLSHEMPANPPPTPEDQQSNRWAHKVEPPTAKSS